MGAGEPSTIVRQAKRALTLLVKTGERFDELEGFRLGAAFSFYATFAIFPLMLLSVSVVGFVIGDDAAARDRLLGAIAGNGSAVRDVLEQTLREMQKSQSARGTSTLVALASLIFSASGAFVELDTSLNKIWRVKISPSHGVLGTIRDFLRDRAIAFLIVGCIGLTLLVSLVSSSLLSAIANQPLAQLSPAIWRTTELGASLLLLSGAITAAFHFVPRSRPPLRDVVGGAVLTTVLLTLLKTVFAAYLAHLTSYSAYGVAGGVLALATWIYLSAQIIFFGATLTRVDAELVRGPSEPTT